MTKRKKSTFESFFSFKQHRRRFGASKIKYSDLDFEAMESTFIDAECKSYMHGSKNNLNHHLNDLRKEFHGATELEYYHAELNVLLRRKFKTKKTFKKLRI